MRTHSALALLMLTGIFGVATESFAAENKEIVAYRLVDAKTMHIDDEKVAQQYKATFTNLGVETRLDGHAGHYDLTYRCPKWESAQFGDHQSAHKWEAWLKSLGFEVAHRHD